MGRQKHDCSRLLATKTVSAGIIYTRVHAQSCQAGHSCSTPGSSCIQQPPCPRSCLKRQQLYVQGLPAAVDDNLPVPLCNCVSAGDWWLQRQAQLQAAGGVDPVSKGRQNGDLQHCTQGQQLGPGSGE